MATGGAIILGLVFITSARAFLIHKCCGANESYSANACEYNNKVNATNWFPFSVLYDFTTNEKMGEAQKKEVKEWLKEEGVVAHSPFDSFHDYKVIIRSKKQTEPKFRLLVESKNESYVLVNVHDNDTVTHDLEAILDDGFRLPNDKFCVDKATRNYYIVRFSSATIFVKKCCPHRQMYQEGNCVPNIAGVAHDDWRPLAPTAKRFDLAVDSNTKPNICTKDDGHYQPFHARDINYYCRGFESDLFDFLHNGSVRVEGQFWSHHGQYCADATLEPDNETVIKHNMIRCLQGSTNGVDSRKQLNRAFGILFLIGGVFLLVSSAISLFVPQLRQTLPNKIAITHNIVLMIVHFTWGANLLPNPSNETNKLCSIRVLIIQYTFLASMFWLNVFCINMSSAFRTTQTIISRSVSSDRRRYLVYSVYAWGIPALISLFTIIMEVVETPRPMGIQRPGLTCFCDFAPSGLSQFIYLYGPMSILLMINSVLFVFTVNKIMGVQRQTSKVFKNKRKDSVATGGTSVQSDKQKLYLYSKLFLVMGISWGLVIINWFLEIDSAFSVIVDTFNILRPIFIFVIFSCKRSVYNLLRNEILLRLGRAGPHDASGRSTATEGISLSGLASRKVSAQEDYSLIGRKPSQDRESILLPGSSTLKSFKERYPNDRKTSLT